MNSLNVEQIRKSFRTRHPFLLIDKIEIMFRENMQLDTKVFLIMRISFVDISHRKQ